MTKFEAITVLLHIAKGYDEYMDPKRKAGAITVVTKLLAELEDNPDPYWKGGHKHGS